MSNPTTHLWQKLGGSALLPDEAGVLVDGGDELGAEQRVHVGPQLPLAEARRLRLADQAALLRALPAPAPTPLPEDGPDDLRDVRWRLACRDARAR